MAMEAVQTNQERLPTPAATAPMENNTRGGTPLATQKAPVQSIPRSRALGCSATSVAMLLTVSPTSEMLAQRLGDLEDIPDYAVFGDCENRSTRIRVDRDNGADMFHTGQMLD